MKHALVPVAGFLGFHYTYRDIKSEVESRIHDEIQKGIIQVGNEFYDDLMAGYALSESQPRVAIAKLMKCFIQGHRYDTKVLVPLLGLLYDNDDWETAGDVIHLLKSGEPLYQSIPDVDVYIKIGSIEVQASPERPEWLQDGFRELSRAKLNVSGNDVENLADIYINLWLYYIQNNELDKAQQTIESLKGLDREYPSWHNVKRWRFFKIYFQKNPSLEQSIETMWSQLPVQQS